MGSPWAGTPRDCQNPWALLEEQGDAVPVILEKNTANYALQLWAGWARRSRSATATAVAFDFGWSPCWPTASSRAIC